MIWTTQSIRTSPSKIQKVSKVAQFSSKTTQISGCKNVHIYTFAIVTVQICTITVTLYDNYLFLFFLSITIWIPSLSQQPRQLNKEEEDKYPTTNLAQPNHHHCNPFQQFIIHHKIDPKSTSNQTKPSKNPTQNQAKQQSVRSTRCCRCIYLAMATRSNSKSTKKKPPNIKPIIKT